jgi:hypothetical protein
MSCRMKSDRQMLLKRGRIPDALLVTNKVSPRMQFASAFWRSTFHTCPLLRVDDHIAPHKLWKTTRPYVVCSLKYSFLKVMALRPPTPSSLASMLRRFERHITSKARLAFRARTRRAARGLRRALPWQVYGYTRLLFSRPRPGASDRHQATA